MTERSPRPQTRLALFIRSLKAGGAERSTVNLAGALAKRGYAVDLVLGRAEGPFLADVPSAVRVVDLAARSALPVLAVAPWRPGDFIALVPVLLDNPPRTLGAIPALARYLRRERPAAMLSALDHGNVAAVIARDLAGVGTRLTLSQRNHLTSDLAAAHEPRVTKLAPLIRRFYPRADAIVAVSDGVADDLAAVAEIPRERIRAIYNAVATPELYAQAAAPLDHPWFVEGAKPVILSVGKLKPQKDYPTLIRAFALLRRERDARLVILGDGPDREALAALAAELGVAEDLDMPGFAPNPFAYMARADLFVLSSAFEGLPGVLIQALACGCPVVSTDCPSGPREILEGGVYGPLTPVGDAAALKEAMAATLASPPDREALRQRGAWFSPERAADAYLDVMLGAETART
ncbi:glycosyltransferase [Hansschlegelia quercus]|uniref:Glycosyltransferase n=1 Tax=Hansschlegelia quercus TaxID=2528245 RepID=A0A4Q9GHA9_9HYPH|nr:glycosyltransferase [Hansschlegelia quercus]TBN53422.1 glycosyltransferase [Hansschlegelia quercus]